MITRKRVLLSILPLLLFLAVSTPQARAASIISDNFDSYTTGVLPPQGGWIETPFTGVGTQNVVVTSTDCVSGKCASMPGSTLSSAGINNPSLSYFTGTFDFDWYQPTESNGCFPPGCSVFSGFWLGYGTSPAGLGIFFTGSATGGGGNYALYDNRSNLLVDNITSGVYHHIQVAWNIGVVGSSCTFTVAVDGGSPVAAQISTGSSSDCWSDIAGIQSKGINGLAFFGNGGVPKTNIDNIDSSGSSPTDTGIFTVTPAGGAVISTSTAATVGVTGYVSAADYVANSTNVTVQFSNAGFASSQLVGPLAALQQQPDSTQSFTFPITSSGPFSFSTTTSIQIIGNYTLKAAITRPQYSFLGFNIFTTTLAASSSNFIVATSTAFGTLQQAVQTQYQQLINSASSTIDTTVCNPISGNFNISGCMVVIFGFPSANDLSNAYTQFQTNIATHQPWGYFNRFFAILGYQGTSTLPVYTANIFLGNNGTTSVITVDPGEMIAGAGTVLNGVTDPENGMNIRQIMEPFVLLMVALGVLFTILADLLGSHRHNQNQHHGTKSKSRV